MFIISQLWSATPRHFSKGASSFNLDNEEVGKVRSNLDLFIGESVRSQRLALNSLGHLDRPH